MCPKHRQSNALSSRSDFMQVIRVYPRVLDQTPLQKSATVPHSGSPGIAFHMYASPPRDLSYNAIRSLDTADPLPPKQLLPKTPASLPLLLPVPSIHTRTHTRICNAHLPLPFHNTFGVRPLQSLILRRWLARQLVFRLTPSPTRSSTTFARYWRIPFPAALPKYIRLEESAHGDSLPTAPGAIDTGAVAPSPADFETISKRITGDTGRAVGMRAGWIGREGRGGESG